MWSWERYSAFPKAPALLEPHDQIVLFPIQDTVMQSVYSLAPTWQWASSFGNMRVLSVGVSNMGVLFVGILNMGLLNAAVLNMGVLDTTYTRMLRAILNKSWQQHPTRHQLYGHLPPITKTIQVRRTRHAGHCWRSRDELIRDVLLWILTHGRAKAGRPARTYIQQLCEDTGCCPEDLPRAMNDREEWRERVRDIRATSVIWWWWWRVIIPRSPWTVFYLLVK